MLPIKDYIWGGVCRGCVYGIMMQYGVEKSMADFFKKKRAFLVRSHRKLEILLYILGGFCYVNDLWRVLPISRFTIYKLLKTYRMQGLIKSKREKKHGKMVLRFEVSDKGFQWLVYMLEKERGLCKERGLDPKEIDFFIVQFVKRKAVLRIARRLFPHLMDYEEMK